ARAPRPAESDRAGAAPPRARPAPVPRAGRPRASTAATAPGIDAPRRGWIGGYAMCARDLLELASNEGRPGGRPCLVLPAQAHGQLDRAGRTGDPEPGALAEVRIRLQADAPPVAEIGVVALVGDVEDVAAHAQAEAAARIPLLLHGQVELEEILVVEVIGLEPPDHVAGARVEAFETVQAGVARRAVPGQLAGKAQAEVISDPGQYHLVLRDSRRSDERHVVEVRIVEAEDVRSLPVLLRVAVGIGQARGPGLLGRGRLVQCEQDRLEQRLRRVVAQEEAIVSGLVRAGAAADLGARRVEAAGLAAVSVRVQYAVVSEDVLQAHRGLPLVTQHIERIADAEAELVGVRGLEPVVD